ncbi:hypothetical protein M8C21_026406 [Ambrosia artemisiifolia]|uniref:DUF8003 domain-containing protein n=1 Tax=Ambrosia artemisiifolia TaxID=4212 RepID=A0AAD5BMI9_AMBAR|nr:hypothetical protein M8C21_026406 [Ambrosia artemisiifolia]
MLATHRLVARTALLSQVGPGSVLRGPLENMTANAVVPKLNCESQQCPNELLNPPDDCNVNASLPFTLQICRVEDILVQGIIKGSVVNFHRARSVTVESTGTISTSKMGCIGGIGKGEVLSVGVGSGGGYGGSGGYGCYNGTCIDGGLPYGNADLPCWLGSGGGTDDITDPTAAGGGVLVIGSLDHPVSSLSVDGSLGADGGSHTIVEQDDWFQGSGDGGGGGGQNGSGGGGGGRIHFHWSRIPTGDVYQPVATVKGNISTWGGLGGHEEGAGESGTVTGKSCPKGLYGTFCEECPIGTYKNVTGSDKELCFECPANELPHRAYYIQVRGFDESTGSAPTHGSQIDHSFPFLESLNEVLETNRVEDSQGHVHRMYEGAFNRFVEEINALATYQWWEGSIYNILFFLAYPLAWSWQQWRQKLKLQRLREFVRSEYDHACLRSCRSRALYEGLKVAATSDLMLAYVDFFLGGDEKRSDLPPPLHQRFPLSLLFGGDGSYMAPFSLHSDNVITTLINQSVPPTTWYRFVAGLNAQLRLVRRGRLRVMFSAIVTWIETYANPTLKIYGIRVDLALFQATSGNNHQYGIVVTSVRIDPREQLPSNNDNAFQDDSREDKSLYQGQGDTNENLIQKKSYDGRVLDIDSVKSLKENRQIVSYALSFIIHNTKPVGHQDLVGLVISVLLLGDFSLVLLTLFQLYSFSLAHVFLVLFILPLGILLPFPAGINALFSQGPRRSSGLARIYALWNITSLVNVVVAFFCGYAHYSSQASKTPSELQPWTM